MMVGRLRVVMVVVDLERCCNALWHESHDLVVIIFHIPNIGLVVC